MYHALNYAPLPYLPPSPLPAFNGGAATTAATAATTAATAADQQMLVSVFLALFLPCAGMSAVFLIYICLLWCSTNYNQSDSGGEARPVRKKGLSAAELEKLPKVSRKELVIGTECAVCLDEIEEDQPARLIPGCNHGFHLQCADTWLSNHSVCPFCRTKLEPQFFNGSENPC